MKINILDCTLRDGGYYNNWQFSKFFIQKYINLISKTRIKYVEIGFLSFPKDKKKGLTANCDKSFFKSFNFPKNTNWGIMINASELINTANSTEEKKIIKNLNDLDKTNLSFIRIACHFNEVFKIERYLKILKKNKNIKLFINVMQISEIQEYQIKKICNYAKFFFDYLYIADSLGTLKKIQIKKIAETFKKYWLKEIGIHAHDNLSLALSNTIYANKIGFNWLDSTITGMGRGPGNTKTEELVKFFNFNDQLNNKAINKLASIFSKLKNKYKWGTNRFYKLSGKYKIHPTYIQTMLSDTRYKEDDYISAIKYLKNNDTKSYNPFALLSAFNIYKFTDKISINKKNNNLLTKKFSQALILGPGKELKKISTKLQKRIKKTKTLVISLNNSKQFNDELIHIRALCHPIRILSNLNYLKNYNKLLLVPYSCLSSKLKEIFKNKNIIDYGILINKKVSIKNNYMSLSSPLALIYSVGYLISKNFKKIYFAGFDGYSKDELNQDSTQELLNDIKKKYKKNKISFVSLTKTKLNLRFANLKEVK